MSANIENTMIGEAGANSGVDNDVIVENENLSASAPVVAEHATEGKSLFCIFRLATPIFHTQIIS
jgi:hypothetical protein